MAKVNTAKFKNEHPRNSIVSIKITRSSKKIISSKLNHINLIPEGSTIIK